MSVDFPVILFEMTGLDLSRDHIIEIAVIITDGHLNIIAEGPELIIHQSKEFMDGMNEWCIKHHGESGLTASVINSDIDMAAASRRILDFIAGHVQKGEAQLAGNTVHMDARFLAKDMPEVLEHLHYRIVDVSTVKELCRRWYPEIYRKAPPKKQSHRALDDIKESIQELKFYRQHIFIPA